MVVVVVHTVDMSLTMVCIAKTTEAGLTTLEDQVVVVVVERHHLHQRTRGGR